MLGIDLSLTSVGVALSQRELVAPAGRAFLTETVDGVVYYLTETISGVVYYLTEAA